MLDTLKHRAFWIVARPCFFLYHHFPVFGKLRAALGIIQRGKQFLIIHRNDGRGYCLPGGICGWKESAEDALRREVQEETGLTVTAAELTLTYFSTADVPCNTSVFEVEADGEAQSSWEGSAHWMLLTEFEPRLLASQRPILDLMRKMSERD